MVLTGSAATEALQLYVRLGSSGARFDRGRILAAVRTRAGRLRLRFAIARSRLWRPPAGPRTSSTRRLRRGASALARHGAQSPPGRPEGRPAFLVEVVLDGDDYPPTATEVVRFALGDFLNELLDDGSIRAFWLTEF